MSYELWIKVMGYGIWVLRYKLWAIQTGQRSNTTRFLFTTRQDKLKNKSGPLGKLEGKKTKRTPLQDNPRK